MRLLYAEDERAMSEAVTDILTYHGYQVDAVYTGTDALSYAEAEKYDGIILDIMMPGADGLAVLRQLRERGVKTPVLLLTAKGELEDKITGLDAGADDYLPKPFAMGELLARVRALLRRREEYVSPRLECGSVSLDTGSKLLSSPFGSVTLSKLEFGMMELFMLNRGRVFSTEQLLEKVWGYETDADLGTVWVYISSLRKKLTSINADCRIATRRSVGYCLEESRGAGQ